MTGPLTITIAQINPIVGDLTYNTGKILRAVEAAEAADLLVFPELSLCGYIPEDLLLKPFFIDQVEIALARLVAASAKFSAAFTVGAPLREGGRLYNALHVVHGGAIVATIRKHHLPNYGVFDEARVFSPGPLPEPVSFRGARLGLLICEDMWNQGPARHLRQQGAEILLVANASPFELDKPGQRLRIARDRVRETGLPLLYVNEVGGQDEIVFDGASFALSAGGEQIVQAASFRETQHPTAWTRSGKGGWLCDGGDPAAAPDGPEALYAALLTGLRDYVAKNGFTGVLIGLSGGIDSALTAVLAVDALGSDAVRGVMMPSRYTAAESLADAASLAENLHIGLDTLPIESMVSAFEAGLGPYLTGAIPGIVHENIQPRSRGILLMALSNATGRLVLSTGNKSEMAVGYATLYGDMCGGFNPLKDVYKTQVYALADWRNRHRPLQALAPADRPIPASTIGRPPTAELKPGQADQDTLPPYDVLDGILAGLIERDLGLPELVAAGFAAETVRQTWQMLDRAEYKRRQAAPGIKVTSKSFGRERRYPITNGFSLPPDLEMEEKDK